MQSSASKSTHRLKNSQSCVKKKLATFSKLQFLSFFFLFLPPVSSSCVSRVGFVQKKGKKRGRIRARVTERDTKAERRTVGETSKAKSSILNQSRGIKKNFFFWVPVLRDNQQGKSSSFTASNSLLQLTIVTVSVAASAPAVRRTASGTNSSPLCCCSVCLPHFNPPHWGN